MASGIGVDDVTKKIKTAITNKLIELGSYVDEDLPDYIMVMVANKKSQTQMTNDLKLFLGSNTQSFTSWLHGILETVQSGEPEVKKKEKKRKATPPVASKPKEKDKWVPIETERPTSTTKTKPKVIEKEGKSPEKEVKTKAKTAETKSKSPQAKTKPKSLENEARPKSPIKEAKTKEIRPKTPEKEVVTSTADTREESDDVISFRTETDDVFTKELQQEEEKELSPTKTIKPKKSITERLNLKSRSRSPESSNKRVPISFPKTSSKAAAIKIRPMLQRKGPSSSVSSVVRKPSRHGDTSYDDEEEEEEYDPTKPSVGSVASIVRVSERKSSIPLELQANKLLLFKAIDDANKSLTKKGSVRGSAPYKPTPIETTTTITPTVKATPPLQVKAVQTNEEEFLQEEVHNESVSTETEIPVKTVVEMVQVVSPMKKQSPVKKQIETVVEQPVIINQVLDEVNDKDLLEEEVQTVIVSPKKGVKRKIDEDISIPMESVLSVPEQQASHTRFVVTLDGVNTNSLFQKPVIFSDDMETNPFPKKRIFTPVNAPEVPDEDMYDNDLELIEKFNPDDDFIMEDEEDDDDEMICLDYDGENNVFIPTNLIDEDSFEESEFVEKKNVRCQYWPACSRGDSCIYVHPSKPCRNFPACSFGSKCINIHPNCKFDSQCTRSDCPFTHASKRNGASSAPIAAIHVQNPKFLIPTAKASVTTVCKFFPKCQNATCPFIHPKLCRYGSFCKTANCPFTHPKTPSVSKLKWVATTSTKTVTEKS